MSFLLELLLRRVNEAQAHFDRCFAECERVKGSPLHEDAYASLVSAHAQLHWARADFHAASAHELAAEALRAERRVA